MIKVRDIEKVVSHLPAKDLAEFRAWFHNFEAAKWDKQFEEDARSGKLDRIAQKAVAEFKKGKCKEL